MMANTLCQRVRSQPTGISLVLHNLNEQVWFPIRKNTDQSEAVLHFHSAEAGHHTSHSARSLVTGRYAHDSPANQRRRSIRRRLVLSRIFSLVQLHLGTLRFDG